MPVQMTRSATLWVRNQYDTAPPLRISVEDEDGNPLNWVPLGLGFTIDIARQAWSHYWSPRGRIVSDRLCTANSVVGQVEYNPIEGDWDQPGEYHVKFTVLYPDGSQSTVPSEHPLNLKIHERIGGP